jgi:hypothetical protein
MDTEFWDAVRERAQALWLQEGCPEGRSEQHWQQAQHDVRESVHTAPVTMNEPDEVTSAEVPTCAVDEVEAQPAAEVATCTASAPADPVPSVPRPQVKGTSLFKIRSRQCRYIVSETDSPTIFCGAPTEGGSWCREHNARVFARSSTKSSGKVERKLRV